MCTVIYVVSYIRTVALFIFGNCLAPKVRESKTIRSFSVIYGNTNQTTVCSSYSNEPRIIEPYSMLGIDSHADVSCAGKDTYVESVIIGRKCEVKGFHD